MRRAWAVPAMTAGVSGFGGVSEHAGGEVNGQGCVT